MVEQLLKKLRDEGINIFRLVLMQKDGSYEIAEAFPTAPCHNCYSVSKAVTATAIGILQDKGKLSVKDSMDNFFDLKEYDSEAWKKINIEHLLNHTTGIGKGFLFEADRYDIPTKDWVDWTLRQPFVYEPGEKYVYSNSTFYLLSVIVEKVSGKTLIEFLRGELFSKLGINEYAWESCPMGHTIGATGLYLMTKDMAEFCRLYLNEGEYNGERILSKDWCRYVHKGEIGSYCGGFTSSVSGRYMVAGAHSQFGIIAPDKGVVLAGHSFIVEHNENYRQMRKEFLDSLPDYKEQN
ncbi:MAG: serine hydrolase [Clostridia bacterium]|nr:serine hydrolase [Clostridia bacterium]